MNDVQPLQLGNLKFDTNLIQAPLAGMSCAPFRELLFQFGGVAYCVTEMISAKTLLHRPPLRYIHKSDREGPLCFQLSGNSPEEMQRAAAEALKWGADLIDINCGCPVDKIRKKQSGSKLLSSPTHLSKIVSMIKKEINVPLSIKIRVDGQSGDRFNTDVVKMAEAAGVDFIIVHGRHWREDYTTPVRLDEIAAIVTAVKIPVIGNGDVRESRALARMFRLTGCKGVMIGRASVGRPWIFAQLSAENQEMPFKIPEKSEIGDLLQKHVSGLIELEGEKKAILQARKFCKYYLQNAGVDSNEYLRFNSCRTFADFSTSIKTLFC